MECKELGKMMHFISNSMKRKIDQKVAEFGLTSVQSRVLHFIDISRRENKPVFQKDLEENFDVRKSTVTNVLQLLEKNGYLKRESVATDARLKQLILTEKGEEATVVVQKIIVEEEKEILKYVSEEEKATFFYVLNKISKSIKES